MDDTKLTGLQSTVSLSNRNIVEENNQNSSDHYNKPNDDFLKEHLTKGDEEEPLILK
jgi:hypothetical protein